MKESLIAVIAAANRSVWGDYASRQFVLNRNGNLALYRLACQLEAVAACSGR